MLNYIDLKGAIANLIALENECATDVGGILGYSLSSHAYPMLRFEAQGQFPVWLNGLSTVKPEPSGIWEDAEPVQIITQLKLGNETEGRDGVLEQQLYTWIPYFLALVRSRPLLTSDAAPTRPTGLLGASIDVSKWRMPGSIISAEFILNLEFFVTNPERDW